MALDAFLEPIALARAALHHLTFLVDDFDAALAHAESAGYAPVVGRQGRRWKQVLRDDKDALAKQGWRRDWEPFATQQPEPAPPVRNRGRAPWPAPTADVRGVSSWTWSAPGRMGRAP